METAKKKCLQCGEEKPRTEYFIYKKSGKEYNWCKECVKANAHQSYENHLAKAQACRQRWGLSA